MMENNHISEENLIAFKQDKLSFKETEQFLEHICSCNFCSEQLANCMSGEMLAAPFDLKENILNAVKRPEIQIKTKVKATSKRMQLLIYSLKVGTATIGALLVLLLTMNFSDIEAAPKITQPIQNEENTFSLTATIKDNMDTLSSSMLNFSNTIMKTEVIDYDQKEK